MTALAIQGVSREPCSSHRSLDSLFDGLADMVERRLDIALIGRLAGVA